MTPTLSKQLATAKKSSVPTLGSGPALTHEEPVKNVTYVYGKDILMMNRQETIRAIQSLEQYNDELKAIKTSPDSFKVYIEECEQALCELAGHLSGLD